MLKARAEAGALRGARGWSCEKQSDFRPAPSRRPRQGRRRLSPALAAARSRSGAPMARRDQPRGGLPRRDEPPAPGAIQSRAAVRRGRQLRCSTAGGACERPYDPCGHGRRVPHRSAAPQLPLRRAPPLRAVRIRSHRLRPGWMTPRRRRAKPSARVPWRPAGGQRWCATTARSGKSLQRRRGFHAAPPLTSR
jgi:hypothetical protein